MIETRDQLLGVLQDSLSEHNALSGYYGQLHPISTASPQPQGFWSPVQLLLGPCNKAEGLPQPAAPTAHTATTAAPVTQLTTPVPAKAQPGGQDPTGPFLGRAARTALTHTAQV